MNLNEAKQILCNANLTVEEQKARDLYFKEFEDLARIAIETAFDQTNGDTELLCRRLLAINKIKLENGLYTRDPFDFEQHFRIDGVEYDREKCFFIEEDKLDEYTKQLEEKIKRLEGSDKNE